MDSSVTPLRHGGLCLVQTTDFFYPLVDDPYMMGKKRGGGAKAVCAKRASSHPHITSNVLFFVSPLPLEVLFR